MSSLIDLDTDIKLSQVKSSHRRYNQPVKMERNQYGYHQNQDAKPRNQYDHSRNQYVQQRPSPLDYAYQRPQQTNSRNGTLQIQCYNQTMKPVKNRVSGFRFGYST